MTVELAVSDDWFVSVSTNNSLLTCFNLSSRQSRWPFDLAISYRRFPMQAALLYAVLVRAHWVYPSKQAAQMYVIPTYLPSQMARSFISISNGDWFPGSYVAWIELHSSLLLVASRSLAFISEAHYPSSLNSCSMHCLTITPLEGVMALNHI